jgi:hypothetical protein
VAAVNRLQVLIVSAISAAVVSGCSGSDDGPDWAALLEGVGPADLAVMVLPPEDLGAEAKDLQISGDSGPLDPDYVAADTIDPADDPAAIISSGFEEGYLLLLVDQSLESLTNGEGLFATGTSLTLYDVAEAAQAALEKERADTEAFTGQDVGGFTLGASTFEENDDVGEQAFSYTLALDFVQPESTTHLTVVQFRVDRLLATATIARGDEADVAEEVQALAAELLVRIEGVMQGEIDETPVPLAGD